MLQLLYCLHSWQSNCTIRPGTSLTWAFVSARPSSSRPCLPSHNMTFPAQIVWPFRGPDCLPHSDKTDKAVPQITAPSFIRLLWTECSSVICRWEVTLAPAWGGKTLFSLNISPSNNQSLSQQVSVGLRVPQINSIEGVCRETWAKENDET